MAHMHCAPCMHCTSLPAHCVPPAPIPPLHTHTPHTAAATTPAATCPQLQPAAASTLAASEVGQAAGGTVDVSRLQHKALGQLTLLGARLRGQQGAGTGGVCFSRNRLLFLCFFLTKYLWRTKSVPTTPSPASRSCAACHCGGPSTCHCPSRGCAWPQTCASSAWPPPRRWPHAPRAAMKAGEQCAANV